MTLKTGAIGTNNSKITAFSVTFTIYGLFDYNLGGF